eukprot:COSAG01_NODE_6542_length_3614_cov_40.782646_2_plen_176_part_00
MNRQVALHRERRASKKYKHLLLCTAPRVHTTRSKCFEPRSVTYILVTFLLVCDVVAVCRPRRSTEVRPARASHCTNRTSAVAVAVEPTFRVEIGQVRRILDRGYERCLKLRRQDKDNGERPVTPQPALCPARSVSHTRRTFFCSSRSQSTGRNHSWPFNSSIPPVVLPSLCCGFG